MVCYGTDVIEQNYLVSLESLSLLFLKANVSDYVVDRLVDSGTSFNFISSALAWRLDWVCQPNEKVTVWLADGSTNTS